MVTIVVAFLIATYMLFDPSHGLTKLMQLTHLSMGFKFFLLVLGVGYFALAWLGENHVFPQISRYLGLLRLYITKKAKRRKTYKLVEKDVRASQ